MLMRKKNYVQACSLLLTGILLMALTKNAASQLLSSPTEFNKIIPPSPEAAGLQTQVKIPVNYATGIANVSIPLFDVKTGNLSLPISLNYHATGIKVDQLSASTGLGWTLNAGGAVQRTIRGGADDWHLERRLTMHYADSLNMDGTLQANNIMMSGLDFTQDDYSYNFAGYGGTFYYDSSKVIHQMVKEPFDLEMLRRPSDNQVYYKARDYNGFTYFFEQEDYSFLTNRASNAATPQPLIFGPAAWKLTKIKYQGIDSLQLSYEKYTINYTLQTTDVYDKLIGDENNPIACVPLAAPDCVTCGDNYPTAMYHHSSQYTYENSLVKQILTRDTRVDFYYSDETGAEVWKRKLDSLVVTSLVDSTVKKRIHLLYTLFAGNEQLKLNKVRTIDLLSGDVEETRLLYYESIGYPLPGLNSRSKDIFGYFNGKTNQFLITTSDPMYPLPSANRDINPETIHLGTLKRIIYPTGGFSDFTYEPNKPDVSNVFGEGIRLKELMEYDHVSGQQTISTYKYSHGTGRTQAFPVNMLADLREVSFRRKVVSSNGTSGSFLVPLSSVYPTGRAFDSVEVRKKGAGIDLLTTYKYEVVTLPHSFSPFLTKTTAYKFNEVTDAYEIVSEDKTTYNHFTQGEASVILDVMSPALTLYASFTDGYEGCRMYTPGIYISDVLQENVIQKVSESSTTYSGEIPITQTASYYYDNPLNMLPTRITKLDSRSFTTTRIKYPHEMVASSLDPTGIYQQMINNKLLTPKIKEEVYDKDDNKLATSLAGYGQLVVDGVSLIALTKHETALRNDPLTTKSIIDQYDRYGNILQYYNYDIPTGIIWDYGHTLPIAQVTNAQQADIAYTSFETAQSGNWSIHGDVYSTAVALTGKRSYVLSGPGTQIRKAVNPAKTYQVTYWSTTSDVYVNGSPGTALVTKNGWTLYYHTITGANNADVMGNGNIDELRLLPVDARMVTYCYEPTLGKIITANSDNNNIVNYHYDGQHRLSLLTDVEGQVVKKISYSLTQKIGNGNYYNTEQFQVFLKNDCGAGFTPSGIKYIVPEETYSSANSVAEANNLALLELERLGQYYANKNGRCTPVCTNCNRPNQRCVNGVCELGFQVYTQSVWIPSLGQYECTYHYEWGDGMWTIDYTHYSSTPCL